LSIEADGFGFLDNPELGRRRYDAILLGNSFAAGQAGCSWVQKLRDRAPKYAIYDAGLPGTGIPNWAQTLTFLQKQGYEFGSSILVFIADDFFRPRWQHKTDELECLRDITLCTDQSYYPLDRKSDLLELSARRAEIRLASNITPNNMKYFWKRNFWVSHFVLSHIVTTNLESSALSVSKDVYDSLDIIINLSRAITLVKITTRDETGASGQTEPHAGRHIFCHENQW
jgi:hypothetical protein